MSKENLEQFVNQVADSADLQARLGEEIDAESLIALGAEHGCEFTAEDLTESAALSDEEMEKVSGGKRSIQVGADNGAGFRPGRSIQVGADNGASFRIVLGLATAQEN